MRACVVEIGLVFQMGFSFDHCRGRFDELMGMVRVPLTILMHIGISTRAGMRIGVKISGIVVIIFFFFDILRVGLMPVLPLVLFVLLLRLKGWFAGLGELGLALDLVGIRTHSGVEQMVAAHRLGTRIGPKPES